MPGRAPMRPSLAPTSRQLLPQSGVAQAVRSRRNGNAMFFMGTPFCVENTLAPHSFREQCLRGETHRPAKEKAMARDPRKSSHLGPNDTSDTPADRPGEPATDSDGGGTGERATIGRD